MQEWKRSGDGRDTQCPGKARQVAKAVGVLAVIAGGSGKMDLAGKATDQCLHMRAPAWVVPHWRRRGIGQRQPPVGGQDQHLKPLTPVRQVVKVQCAVALGGPKPAKAKHATEPPPGRSFAWQAGDGKAIRQYDPRRRDQPHVRPAIPCQFPRASMGPHDPGDRVHIRHRNPRHAHRSGAFHQLLGV